MNDRAESIRQAWASQRAAAYEAEEDTAQSMQTSPSMTLDLTNEETRSSLPQPVLEAYHYYFAQVESADWGSVSVSQENIQNQEVLAVNVSTDGDDGWVELFDRTGQSIGAARTLLAAVDWGDTAGVRSSTDPSTPFIDSAATKTDQSEQI